MIGIYLSLVCWLLRCASTYSLPAECSLNPGPIRCMLLQTKDGYEQRRKTIVKRAIRMKQTEYKFLSKDCSPGTVIGNVSAADGNQPILYVMDTPSNNVATGIRNGQIYLINYLAPGTTYNIIIRATSPTGSSSARVSYGCLGQSGMFPSSIASSAPQPQAPVGPARFTQPSYSIKSVTCTPGSIVGGVQAVGSPGKPCIYTSTAKSPYSVIPTTGQILLTAQTTGIQTFTVQAGCPGSGAPVSTTVTVIASCSPTPTFSRQFYDFQLPSCNPGQLVGSISASNTQVYVIDPTSRLGNLFSVTASTGEIRTTGILSAPVYNFNVKAHGVGGASANTAVQVRTNCAAKQLPVPMRFTAGAYTFSPKNCSENVVVGKVTAIGGSGGVITYSLNNPSSPLAYKVGATNGGIFSVGTPVAGTITVQASSGSERVTVPVTMTLGSCPQTSKSNFAAPTFSQDSYFFNARTCEKNSPIGSVFASSSAGTLMSYALVSPSPVVNIDPRSGILMVAADLTGSRGIAGTTTKLVVQANNGFGTKGVIVSVHLNCGLIDSGNVETFPEPQKNIQSDAQPNEFPSGAELGNSFAEKIQNPKPISDGPPVFVDNFVHICNHDARCIGILSRLDEIDQKRQSQY